MGSLALAACGGAGSESEELFDDGVGGHGSSGALTPDADSGVEDGATGEDGAAPMVCAPGKVEACPCPGGGQGAQACRDDGSGFEPCECGGGDDPADAGSDTSDDVANGGGADPLPYDCETTYACGCTLSGGSWCLGDPNISPEYTKLYSGCTGRPKHCQEVAGHAGWWCCKY